MTSKWFWRSPAAACPSLRYPYPPWFSHEACHLVRGLLKLSCEKCAEGLAISMNMGGGVPKIRVPQKRWMVKKSGKSYIKNLDDELWVFPHLWKPPYYQPLIKMDKSMINCHYLWLPGTIFLGIHGDLGVHFQTKHMGAAHGDTQYWMVDDRENPSINRWWLGYPHLWKAPHIPRGFGIARLIFWEILLLLSRKGRDSTKTAMVGYTIFWHPLFR